MAEPDENSGGRAGIGGDTTDRRYLTAWFYGDRAISTCINHVDSFGVSRSKVEEAVKAAIMSWQRYLKAKDVNGGAGENSLNARFDLTGTCKGGEDLRLYFGTGPIFGNLRDLKASLTLGKPAAYANKTHIAGDYRWSRGYIRFLSHGVHVADPAPFPNWKKPDALEALVTHEFGHILGFQHTDDTIMDERIAAMAGRSQGLKEIDWERELVSCHQCSETFALQADSLNKKAADQLVAALQVKEQEKVQEKGVSLTGLKGTLESLSFDRGKISVKIAGTAVDVASGLRERHGGVPVHLSNFPESQISTMRNSFYGSLGGSVPVTVTPQIGARGWVLRAFLGGRFADIADFSQTSTPKPGKVATRAVPKKRVAKLSLLQDKKGLTCAVEGKPWLRVDLERRDRVLTVRNTKPGGGSLEFLSESFLFHAVILHNSRGSVFFDVLPDGRIYMIDGRSYRLTESACDDTGASKRCAVGASITASSESPSKEQKKTLFWSPEVLALENGEVSERPLKRGAGPSVGGAVERYGILGTRATYFASLESGDQALVVVDRGAALQLVEGQLSWLQCKYADK